MPEITFFFIIVALTKRQNKREQKLKLLWLNGVYFKTKGKRKIFFQGLSTCKVLIKVYKNTSEWKQHLQWVCGATQMLRDFHRIAIWKWLLKPWRYEAEQCSFLLQGSLCVSMSMYYAIAYCIHYSLLVLTYDFAFGHKCLPQTNLWRNCYINYLNYWESQEISNVWVYTLFRIFSGKLILAWNSHLKSFSLIIFHKNIYRIALRKRNLKKSNRNFYSTLIKHALQTQGY